MQTIDLTRQLTAQSLSYPGDRVGIEIRTGDAGSPTIQATHLTLLDLHLGTHMDAPLHFVPGAADIERLGACLYPALVLRARERPVTPRALPATPLTGCAVLFDTGWIAGPESRAYFENYAYVSPGLARELVARGAALVGIDTPSVDAVSTACDYPAHRVLLGAGIPIVEGLCNLDAVPKCSLEAWFGAFPLRIKGADGAPVRAVVIIP